MIIRALINFGLFLVVALFFAVVLVEWAVGCGEAIYLADGTWITGECVFSDNEIKTGRWRPEI